VCRVNISIQALHIFDITLKTKGGIEMEKGTKMIETVIITNIKLDAGTQSRAKIDNKVVNRYCR